MKDSSEKFIETEQQLDIMKLKKDRESLVSEMENYYKVYRHKNPCNDWKKNKWCIHYVKARAKKFRNRVDDHMSDVLSFKEKAYI